TLSRQAGAPSLKQQADAREKQTISNVESDPLVQSVLARFPGAKVVAVRQPEEVAPPPAISANVPAGDGGEDIAFDHMIEIDDDF
ncbi:MAG: DNA polymerase III subunit gamma/tau, partial [Beijerinckiaceae bacterium]|nr:DNA polymerase III subunit gamma/tau [Beijerinckiaceae bacterium]